MEAWASVSPLFVPSLSAAISTAITRPNLLFTTRKSGGLLVVSARKKNVAEDDSASSKRKKNQELVKNAGEEKNREAEEEEDAEREEAATNPDDFPLEDLKRLWEKGWAPWEEVHPPENRFALKSAKDASVENPRLSQEVMDILDNKGPKAELTKVPVQATEYIDEPAIFCLVPPRDWPPPGWEVDPKELEFIRETHTMYPHPCEASVNPEEVKNAKAADDPSVSLDRYKLFLKQYHHWVDANKESLDKEADLVDPEYSPGRRRTGKYYAEGMLELPFIYPGQHYIGTVEQIDLHDGAFVNFGAVHDGWVCIRDNDWFKLRHVIQVGRRVHVEVTAKRDPYRYRFPIELRFVNPDVDRDIFWRFKHPPIIARPGDTKLEEVARETGRPFVLDLEPCYARDPDPRTVAHPYLFTVWQRHTAENLVLDVEESKEKGGRSIPEMEIKYAAEDWEEYRNQGVEEKGSDDENDEEDDEREKNESKTSFRVLKPTEGVPYQTLLVNVDEKELDLDAARKERRMAREMFEEAVARGEDKDSIVLPVPRRERVMMELEQMHKQRCYEEEKALVRDIACRMEAGLAVDDPRYSDDPWHPNKYNPRKKIWQADYIGPDTKSWKYSKLKRDKRPRRMTTMKKRS